MRILPLASTEEVESLTFGYRTCTLDIPVATELQLDVPLRALQPADSTIRTRRLLSSFLIALREGVEAALVVGIVLVYLNRTGRSNLARWVWGGVLAAVVSSLAVAIALDRWKVSEDGFEGVLLLVAAVFVVTMILWMNRVARRLKKEIEQHVEKHAAKSEFSAGIGLATFVFLMVIREGAELALILRAVELSSEGLAVW